MTPVDAFDTMVLMGLKEEANDTKELIFNKLSFDKNISVQNFEITIRLLGGLISAYQLDGDKRFLDFAEDLETDCSLFLILRQECPTDMLTYKTVIFVTA